MMHWIYAHLIVDYLIQNDWMAAGKKKSSWICAAHVATYLVPFAFTTLAWWQVALVGLQHFAQDRTGFVAWLMRAKGSGAFACPPCGSWSVIVTDNILHVLWMAAVAAL